MSLFASFIATIFYSHFCSLIPFKVMTVKLFEILHWFNIWIFLFL